MSGNTLIKAERKSEWTGMMNLGLLEGDKSHWMGEIPRKDLDRELPHGQIANAVSVLKHQKQ